MLKDANVQMNERYRRAASLMQGYGSHSLVQNSALHPHWIGDTGFFWYERHSDKAGREFRLVDGRDGTNEAAFDHQAFAGALEAAAGKPVEARHLPITQVRLFLSPTVVAFKAFGAHWEFAADDGVCRPVTVASDDPNDSLSPDGKLLAFCRDYNLWLRDLETTQERALTDDGEEDWGYAVGSSVGGRRFTFGDICALWSPDGRRLLFVRRDRRNVKTTPFVCYLPKDASLRPQLETLKVPYPGDEHVETYEIYSVEATDGALCKAHYPPIPTVRKDCNGFFKGPRSAWWSHDSRHAYFVDHDRYCKYVRIVAFDTQTGATRVVYEETSSTYVALSFDETRPPIHCPLKMSNELLWWTERSGWGHLILIDLDTGDIKNDVTRGEWIVKRILHVDEQRREAIVQTAGRNPGVDPYYGDICRVTLDTGEVTELAAGDEDYMVHFPENAIDTLERMKGTYGSETSGVSPDGTRIVATRSRADSAPVHMLLDKDGDDVAEIEKTNISNLPEGWNWPEPVTLLAADGKTDIYGLVHRPSDFSPDKSYPVVNYINGAPWLQAVPKSSFDAVFAYSDRHYFHASALAELGFIVVQIDSRGTPFRSKAFRDQSYGWIQSAANCDDHVSALKQLAERYPYMDLDRAAVVAKSYTAGIQNFLERQDFYKACLTWFIIDHRICVSTYYSDMFEGPAGPPPDRKYPDELVKDMTGKLCMMYAAGASVARAYGPAGPFRIIDALQRANKDFELVMVHDAGFSCSNYMFRRGFDFLVRELTDDEPPRQFDLGAVKVGAAED